MNIASDIQVEVRRAVDAYIQAGVLNTTPGVDIAVT